MEIIETLLEDQKKNRKTNKQTNNSNDKNDEKNSKRKKFYQNKKKLQMRVCFEIKYKNNLVPTLEEKVFMKKNGPHWSIHSFIHFWQLILTKWWTLVSLFRQQQNKWQWTNESNLFESKKRHTILLGLVLRWWWWLCWCKSKIMSFPFPLPSDFFLFVLIHSIQKNLIITKPNHRYCNMNVGYVCVSDLLLFFVLFSDSIKCENPNNNIWWWRAFFCFVS